MQYGGNKMWNREMVQRKKGYGFVTGEDGEDYFAHFSQIKMEGFKMLSGKQPVQFEVGTDENGRALAMNILPLIAEEDA